MTTIADTLADAKKRLASVSETASLDAELLLLHVIQQTKTYLFTWPDKILNEQAREEFDRLLSRRLSGEPIAHIIGCREFWTLNLEVNPSTLIPRPDTERLVELALDFATQFPSGQGLDLGTGTGAIALAMASELPNWQWLGIDKEHEAVALATRNKTRNNINNCDFEQSDWFDRIGERKFNLILSNPPYIDENDIHLSQGDVRFEPHSALVADNQGLADIEHICALASQYLLPDGALMLEHGFDQGDKVRQVLSQNGFHQVATYTDLGGNDRVTVGYFK